MKNSYINPTTTLLGEEFLGPRKVKRMKKYIMTLIVVLLTVSLCACSERKDEKNLNSTEVEKTETQVSDESEEAVPTEFTEQENKSTVEKTEEATSEENSQGTEFEEPENESKAGKTEEVTSEENYPGPDVVEIVNLRGDTTTVYKLADGTYMDRIERRFTYNGTDTWTDEDGVEWNEVVK